MRKNRLIAAGVILLALGFGGYFGYVRYYLPAKFHRLSEKIVQAAMAKLNEAAVEEIRALYASCDHTQASLARQFGVHQTQISNIVNLRRWGCM